MKRLLISLAAAGLLAGLAAPVAAQSVPPQLPALTAEQSANLDRELERYRRDVDDRVARGELHPDEAERLLEWRRWQLAQQMAGLAPAAPPRVVVQREYVAPPPRPYYDPYDGPYSSPYYGPYYAPPPPPYYYYGPRVSVCAGGFGRHSFGSICF